MTYSFPRGFEHYLSGSARKMNYGDAQNGWLRAGQPGPQQPGQPGMPQQGIPGQHMQQTHPQQRMMMGGGPQPGQMGPGGQMPRPMYGMPGMAPQVMQQQGYTAAQQQQMVFQQQQLQHVFRSFPPSLQQQINAEPDHTKRAIMIKTFHSRNLQQQQLHQQQAAAAAAAAAGPQQQVPMSSGIGAAQRMQVPSGPMVMRQSVTQPSGYGPGVMPPMAMQQQASQHPGQQQNMQMQRMLGSSGPGGQPGMSSGMQAGGPLSVPSASHPVHAMAGSNSVSAPQQPAASPQIAALQAGGAGMGSSPANLMGQSPANPRTPGQGPQSVGTAPNSQQAPASQEEAITPEYTEKLKTMKDKHYEDLKRIFERSKLDGQNPPKGLERLMEVMEEKRTVTLQLLEKLHTNVGTLVERQSLTYPLLEAVRCLDNERRRSGGSNTSDCGHASIGATATVSTSVSVPDVTVEDSIKYKFPDPWAPVRHLMIRVPEHVRALFKDGESSAASDALPVLRKRPINKEDDLQWNSKSGVYETDAQRSAKKARIEEQFQTSKAKEEQQNAPAPIQIPCMFDARVQWMLSPEATQELDGAKWRIEADHAPAGQLSPDVLICIESNLLMCCPLRILLPRNYPVEPAVVLYERSFPASAPLSSQLEALFRRRIGVHSERSLTAIQAAWHDACEQQLRLQNGGMTGPGPCLMPNNQTQQQLVA